MIDFPQWTLAVWINIATSITVTICLMTFVAFGWWRRSRLNVVQDGERLSITAVLLGLIAFFLGRGIQIWVVGSTVAQPWFLAIGAFLAVSCLICTVMVARNHDEYEVIARPPSAWKPGDEDRRKNDRRKADRHKGVKKA